jgi:hypothetical protein
VGTGSREENASKQELYLQEAILNRRLFLMCCRGLIAAKAAQAARSAWRFQLFHLLPY